MTGAESLRVRRPRGFVVTSLPAAVSDFGCRSRAARRATPALRRGNHGTGRARPIRWAGLALVKAAAVRVVRRLLPHPGHEFGPRNPGGVVRAGLCMCVAAASRGAAVARLPAGRGAAPLTNVPNGQCRDRPPELVIRVKHPVVAMPVLSRRRDEIGRPVEELKRWPTSERLCTDPRKTPLQGAGQAVRDPLFRARQRGIRLPSRSAVRKCLRPCSRKCHWPGYPS